MAMGLATCAPQGLSPLELRSSLEFSPPESWVLDAHPGRLQGEESGPRPTSATAGSCLSGLGMWSRSQLLRARPRMRPSPGSHPTWVVSPFPTPTPSPQCVPSTLAE